MLHRCHQLRGCHLAARDGEIGKVEDFYFDDQHWTVRYLVADTGYWLPDRLVLISPYSVQQLDEDHSRVQVDLNRHQIEQSPPITADQPVSRQYEREYYQYYGWPLYWTGPALWGPGPYPLYYPPLPAATPPDPTAEPPGDPHLRSVNGIGGYQIQARDGEIGHVRDCIVDEKNWAVRYLEVDTGTWWPGKKVLVAPQWIKTMSWERSSVEVDLPQHAIQEAPAYDESAVISRDYEVELFKHYSREGYWSNESSLKQDNAA